MTFQFAPAKREQVSLLIALAGASGSGKTYSALRLARGMSPDGKIMFIDTEARRGLHYAEHFKFMHADMRPPFTPARFVEGIQSAEAAGAEVVIIDSFSHEYDGVGGIMDWADRLASEGVKSPGNWKEPKGAHKKLMNALLQCRASIIFCLRADEKIEILRENNKTVVRPLGWMPICEKRFMFEMTASFTLTPDRPGIPHFDLPHKLQQQHRSMFSDREPIGEESGRLLATWAAGGEAPDAPTSSPVAASGAEELSAAEWDIELGKAAEQGNVSLVAMWEQIPREHKPTLKAALDRRHKLTAAEADRAKAPA
ncbi:AAA family ATPase [Bradyrhizobium sp. 48]|uniref:AAA family ATPase n=1 Tax=Bradyrhizobium sp. 48 TaxID=2782676 RepID=UPI001FF894DF|nr:AAA family ATPase [Bradyrhizobium sp. 48]MCK1445397.1 AAA family ATPase [Bradyrhizobium sp. 48]